MALTVNLRHLDADNVELKGELPAEDLDIDTRDEMIQISQPLHYELEAQKVEDGILVHGKLRVMLDCKCVRCLEPFQYDLRLNPWSRLLPLKGEEAVPALNDCVDLTPIVREDILLEFPPHPVCDSECRGLPQTSSGKAKTETGPAPSEQSSSAWAELNKLKF